MAWFRNQGWNNNLWVQLSGGPVRYQIDVYVVALFRFHFSPGALNWTTDETDSWKRRFANLAYETWSEKWDLRSDVTCDESEAGARSGLPRCRVRVHAVDVEAPSVPLASRQNMCAILVYRPAPGEARGRQSAHAIETSAATVADSRDAELPAGTSTARLYEDSLELRPNDVDENLQITAMHEFGHMLGLMHPNDMLGDCQMDRSARICYGQAATPESASIMGRGQEVRRDDYRVFEHIVSRLVTRAPSSGLMGELGLSDDRLYWFVEGSTSAFCEGVYALNASRRTRSRFTRGFARRPGPTGVA